MLDYRATLEGRLQILDTDLDKYKRNMAGTVHGSPKTSCLWSSLDHLTVIDAIPTIEMRVDESVSEIVVIVAVG